mgnify:CR=1 FL=1
MNQVNVCGMGLYGDGGLYSVSHSPCDKETTEARRHKGTLSLVPPVAVR